VAQQLQKRSANCITSTYIIITIVITIIIIITIIINFYPSDSHFWLSSYIQPSPLFDQYYLVAKQVCQRLAQGLNSKVGESLTRHLVIGSWPPIEQRNIFYM